MSTETASNALLQAALDYAARGWPVFPCKANKSPLISGGFKGASTDSGVITSWWTQWPAASIGVPTGQASQMWALDIDDLSMFEIAWPWPLPETLRSATGKGNHLLFKHDLAQPMKNAQRLPNGQWPFADLPGAETRGEGGYIIVPPSVHPSGKTYAWDNNLEVADAPAELLALLSRRSTGKTSSGADSETKPASPTGADTPAGLAALNIECDSIRHAPNGSQEKALNDAGLRLGRLVAHGEVSLITANAELIRAGRTMPNFDAANPWTSKLIEAKVKRALRDGAQPAEAHDNLPTIHIVPGGLPAMAAQAELTLKEAGAPIFVRGGLVRPVVDELRTSDGNSTRVPRLVRVDVYTLIDHLARTATWVKHGDRPTGGVRIDPPLAVARTILSRDGEWTLRPLAGVITTPTLRPDGSLLSVEGYDEDTQLLLMEPPELPHLSAIPTRSDALEALETLAGLLAGFPFADAASRSVALSALITPVVRGAIPVAPIHVVTAPVAGTGKSYLVDLASAILTGDRAPVLAAGRNEEETEKRLGAAALSGQSIISIDNINGRLGGDMLCMLIERPQVTIRPLGGSERVIVRSRATCFATGNNVHIVGDLTRRAIMCSLDPNSERPELRTFSEDPLGMILRDRGKYVSAALTVVRAYVLAGNPGSLSPLGSFEAWSRLVRSSLVWLGCADPVATMDSARADDPVLATLRIVLPYLHQLTAARAQTAGGIVASITARGVCASPENPPDALVEAVGNAHSDIDPGRLGRFLGRHKARIVDGLKLIGNLDSHSKQQQWQVVRV